MKFGLVLLFFSFFLQLLVANITQYDSLEFWLTKSIAARDTVKTQSLLDSICNEGKIKDDKTLRFFCYHFIARTQYGKEDKKLKSYVTALKYAQNNSEVDERYLVGLYLALGTFYFDISDWQKGVSYTEKALQTARETNNHNLFVCLNIASVILLEIGDTATSLAYQEELFERYGNTMSPFHFYLNRFDYFFILNKQDSAFYYGTKFIETQEKSYGIRAEIMFKLGNMKLTNRDTVGAVQYFKQAIENDKRINDKKETYDIAQKLIDIFISQGNNEEALYYRTICKNIEDSLLNIETIRNITNAENELEKNTASKYKMYVIFSVLVGLCLLFYFFFSRVFVKNSLDKENQSSLSKFEISNKEYSEIESKMEQFYTNKLFLNKDCNMGFLVRELNLKNEKYLRGYIRKKYNKTFNDFINELRIEYIKKRLENEKTLRSFTMDQIAYEAGFSSRVIFSRIFKKYLGEPPIDFIKNIGV